jgi:hypothetical protein
VRARRDPVLDPASRRHGTAPRPARHPRVPRDQAAHRGRGDGPVAPGRSPGGHPRGQRTAPGRHRRRQRLRQRRARARVAHLRAGPRRAVRGDDRTDRRDTRPDPPTGHRRDARRTRAGRSGPHRHRRAGPDCRVRHHGPRHLAGGHGRGPPRSRPAHRRRHHRHHPLRSGAAHRTPRRSAAEPPGHRLPGQLRLRGRRPGDPARDRRHRTARRRRPARGVPGLDLCVRCRVHVAAGQPQRTGHPSELGPHGRLTQLLPRALARRTGRQLRR